MFIFWIDAFDCNFTNNMFLGFRIGGISRSNTSLFNFWCMSRGREKIEIEILGHPSFHDLRLGLTKITLILKGFLDCPIQVLE